MKERIVLTARKYLGQRETPNNSGFKEKDFEQKMRDTGWSKSQAWCSYFAELVWKESYADNPEMVKRFDKLFSGSATATYKQFSVNTLFTCDMNPEPGCLAVYRYGIGWQGHIGIVESVQDGTVTNIEGNTNAEGGREGVEVARKTRKIKGPYTAKGLNIIGYIHPL